MVKITGEFWAQITEGDGNFHMFEFLEREGAQVLVEPIATWVAYLLYQVQSNAPNREGDRRTIPQSAGRSSKALANEMKYRAEVAGTRRRRGDVDALLPSRGQTAWAASRTSWFRSRNWPQLAHPFYHQLRARRRRPPRSGKNVYYTVHHCATWCWR